MKAIKIGKNEYKINPMSAKKAFLLKAKIIKIIAPAFGGVVGSISGSGNASILDTQIDGNMFSGAIEKLMAHVDENSFFELITEMLDGVLVITYMKKEEKSEKTAVAFSDETFEMLFDHCFQSQLSNVYKLIFEILKINYSDFFAPIQGIGDRLRDTGLFKAKEKETL